MTGIEGYTRYAVFWAPPAGSGLARYGANWLGWDAEAGCCVSHSTHPLPRPLAEITHTPRRYGFHATLKPPFRLTAGTDATALDQALLTLAAQRAPATSPGLAPTTSLGFLALMPTGPAPQINALAAACTRDLDRFRAAPTQGELAQRRTRPLSARQDANLTRWGYPYVLDDYHFHLTLTDRLQPGEAEALSKAAIALATPHLDPVQHFDEICLFGDPGGVNGFRLLRRYPLMGQNS